MNVKFGLVGFLIGVFGASVSGADESKPGLDILSFQCGEVTQDRAILATKIDASKYQIRGMGGHLYRVDGPHVLWSNVENRKSLESVGLALNCPYMLDKKNCNSDSSGWKDILDAGPPVRLIKGCGA